MNQLDEYVAMLQNITMQLQLPNMVNPLTQQDVALKHQLVQQYNQLQSYISQARNTMLQQQQLQRQNLVNAYGTRQYNNNQIGVSSIQAPVSVGTTIQQYNGYGVDNGIQASVASNSRFSKYANKQTVIDQYKLPSAEVKFNNFQLPKKEESKKEDVKVNKDESDIDFAPGHKLPFLYPEGYTEIVMENDGIKTRHVTASNTTSVNLSNIRVLHHKGKNINSVGDIITEFGHKYFNLDGVVSYADVKYYIPVSMLKETYELTTSELRTCEADRFAVIHNDEKFAHNPLLDYLNKLFTKDLNKRLEHGTCVCLMIDDILVDLPELLSKFTTPETIDKDIQIRTALDNVLKDIKSIVWSISAGEENSEKKIICASIKRKVLWLWSKDIHNAFDQRSKDAYSISSASYPELYKVMSSVNADRFELRLVNEFSNFETWDVYAGVSGTYAIERR